MKKDDEYKDFTPPVLTVRGGIAAAVFAAGLTMVLIAASGLEFSVVPDYIKTTVMFLVGFGLMSGAVAVADLPEKPRKKKRAATGTSGRTATANKKKIITFLLYHR